MLKARQTGFTLIELMVVIVIIGILVAIALPNFIGAQDRSKVASVKSNMHTFQVMMETYGVDWGGTYPNTLASLDSEATAKNYLKTFSNPFSGITLSSATSAAGLTLAEVVTGGGEPASWTSTAIFAGPGGAASFGQVVYRRSLASEHYQRYTIYGLDKTARFIQNKGRAFVLTND